MQPPARDRDKAAVRRAHPCPAWRCAHAPWSGHPGRHRCRHSCSTSPCRENRRSVPRWPRNRKAQVARARRDAPDASPFANLAMPRSGARAAIAHGWPVSEPEPYRCAAPSLADCRRQRYRVGALNRSPIDHSALSQRGNATLTASPPATSAGVPARPDARARWSRRVLRRSESRQHRCAPSPGGWEHRSRDRRPDKRRR